MGLWMPQLTLKREILMKIKKGQTIGVHYVGTLDDGTEFDNSKIRGNPLVFKIGERQVISGFENAVIGMKVGETKKVSLTADEAYGSANASLVREIPKTTFPEDFNFVPGALVEMRGPDGQPLPATIKSFGEDNVTLDFNHPLSGKNLNFEIEVVDTDVETE